MSGLLRTIHSGITLALSALISGCHDPNLYSSALDEDSFISAIETHESSVNRFVASGKLVWTDETENRRWTGDFRFAAAYGEFLEVTLISPLDQMPMLVIQLTNDEQLRYWLKKPGRRKAQIYAGNLRKQESVPQFIEWLQNLRPLLDTYHCIIPGCVHTERSNYHCKIHKIPIAD